MIVIVDSHVHESGLSCAPKPERHDHLWFGDGSVVLGTDAFVFRVHTSVLSQHSIVFKDMFELSSTDISNPDGDVVGLVPELFDGLPFAALSGDKGEDVAHLLRAIYDGSYLRAEDVEIPFETIVALLRLSTKYEVTNVKRDVLRLLLGQYPSTLAELDKLSKDAPLRKRTGEETLTLLQAVVEAGATSQFPTIYYTACARNLFSEILAAYPVHLDIDTFRVLLKGRQELQNAILSIFSAYIIKSEGCRSERTCVQRFGDSYHRYAQQRGPSFLKTFQESLDLSSISGEKLIEKWPQHVCERCSYDVKCDVEKARKEVWQGLPGFFGLPDWPKQERKISSSPALHLVL